MPNDFSSLPIVLDGVMAAGYQATVGVPNNLKLYPTIIHWDNPTLAGDQFEILDAAGNILFKATAEANLKGRYFDVAEGVRWPDTWQLTTLDSGVLYIYFRT